MLWSSRDLAVKTAATLTGGWFCGFFSLLTLLTRYRRWYKHEEIASEKDLKEAQAELQQYVVIMPRLAFIEFPYSDKYSFRRTRIR